MIRLSFQPYLQCLLLALLGATAAQGQSVQTNQAFGYWEDVVNFSDLYPSGTARMNALQGASVGLGGDISNAASNPAGLGFLRKSEFSFSPSLLVTNTLNTQAGGQTTGRGSNFHFGNLGYVSAHKRSDAQGGAFRGGAFAITLTRLNHFNNYRTFNTNVASNSNGKNSYIDAYLDGAAEHLPNSVAEFGNVNDLAVYIINTPLSQNELLTENEFESRYAYSRYLIDTVRRNDTLFWYSKIPTGSVNQQGRIYDRGYQNQVDMAYGFNLEDKLYIGGGIGIPYLNQTRQVLYTETLLRTDSSDAYSKQYEGFSFDRREEYTWSGVGFNAKIGLIYNVNEHVRLGASAQTPSWYRIQNDYTFNVDPRFTNALGQAIVYDSAVDQTTGDVTRITPTFSENDQQVVYRIVRETYSMRTPGQFSGGITLLDDKLGFVTVQGTLLPYSMARLAGNTYVGDNNRLQAETRLVTQLRGGVEYKIGPIFRVRGGLAWLQNPVKTAGNTFSYSFGAGVRTKAWYIDWAANVFQRKQQYTVFRYAPAINTLANNVNVQATVGWFF